MKKIDFIISLVLISILVVIAMIFNYIDNRKFNKIEISKAKEVVALENEVELEEVYVEPIVYDGMTLTELANKLDRSLTSTLTGSGMFFAKYSIEYNVNPYLAVAIALHESGCKWNCSNLVRRCNNVGGQKFKPACYAGSSFGGYATLEDGIKGFVSNIAHSYIEVGLTTPEMMQKKYVGTDTTTWAPKVEQYMKKIKAA